MKMFSTQICVVDTDEYDFTKSENADRWRGVFAPSLKKVSLKVLDQVHRGMTANEEALLYVESVCLRILAMLVGKPLPHSVQDLEEKVRKTFPDHMRDLALNDVKEILTKKRKPVLPTDRVHSLLQKDVLQYKIDISVTLFVVGVLETISAGILKWAGCYVHHLGNSEIRREDIELVKSADNELMSLVDQNNATKLQFVPSPLATLPNCQRASTTYEELVKELIHDEKQYQRDLHMIIRVFREKLLQVVKNPHELDPIFSNIMDIYEVTVTLLGSLEDAIEMSQEQGAPYVGNCFEELAEVQEFEVYSKYAQDVTSQESKDALATLLAKPEALPLMSAGHGFREAVKYFLPKLLMVPVWHAFAYFEYIKMLIELSPSQDDINSLEQVSGLLSPLRSELEEILSKSPFETTTPFCARLRRKLATERTREFQNTVEHWDDKDVGQCNEFIREDSLSKLSSGKRTAERKVYLFDGLMILCKPIIKRQVPSAGNQAYDYRLKEKFYMRKVEIIDRADTDELRNSFEINTRVQPSLVLLARNAQHKNDWMADLIMVNTKTMLDQILERILDDLEKKHPLRMPSPDIYKFAEPDSPNNIVLEERESTGVPLIKGATLHKLIERLTYHIYADPMFVRTFLTTYRSFCTPQQLLELLIERFRIPEPSLVYPDVQNDKDPLNCDTDKLHKTSQREDWKRYRKEYVQPVQFRVLNVLRHWVDHHFYDFEKDPTLLENLKYFLDNINVKSVRKWVDSVLKIVQRKNEQEQSQKQITYAFGHNPPPIERHLNVPDSEITLLTLHPLELARQMTLLEFELYKNVKPSELVGSPWTKKDKELKSPNLRKIMKHTTNVTLWIEKSIIEAENYEERVAMVTRAIEVMMVMLELNNFSGILSISSAMGSASVHRLRITFQALPDRYEKILKEWSEINDGHLKKYQERLRSINPPCVPFFGRYLTDILHLEEGNPDCLPNTELINFSKRRKVSEIIGEIQQYQNQPYCLSVDSKIRNFLENLDPFKGMTEPDISNFLYHESLRIEPRGCKQPLKFPRKWPSVPLKSPGIKPRRQNNSSGSNSNQSTLSFGSQRSHTHSICESISSNSTGGGGEQSPTGGSVGIGSLQNQSNNTVFASVFLPERSSLQSVASMAISATASQAVATTLQACSASGTPTHKYGATVVDDTTSLQSQHFPHQTNDSNGELTPGPAPPVPQLPKKPSGLATQAHVWSGGGGGAAGDHLPSGFSPSFLEESMDSLHNLPESELHAAHQHLSAKNNSNQYSAEHQSLPPSPLPRVVVSPRHDVQAAATTGSRSPFHTGHPLSYSKSNCSPTPTSGGVVHHFSPTDSIASTAVTCSPHHQPSHQHPHLIERNDATSGHTSVVPVSPHVNVPPHTSANVEYRTAPPPLPPRRKDRTESCAELAQKKQAPDAPQLPPRDGELSPPPIPPRLGTLPRPSGRQATNEFMGGKRLLQPNTSSIMIRRNSAIEKRAAQQKQQQQHENQQSTHAQSQVIVSTPTVMPTVASFSEDQQSTSPAASSSSATASPRTPMTPISPHIPTGYRILENSSSSPSSYQAQQARLKPSPPAQATYLHNEFPQQQHHAHSHAYHCHHHQHSYHHRTPPTTPPHQSQPPQEEFFPTLPTATEDTPKLPPKPSLSGNFYNNADKNTKFVYPSTNHD